MDGMRRRQLLPVVLALLVGLGLAGGGYAVGRGGTDRVPTSASADAGFARDMAVHHAQAVLLASLLYDRTDDPELRYLAFDVMTGQQAQIGMMQGWLKEWRLPQRDDSQAVMGWMRSHDAHMGHGGGGMPGMASAADVAALRAARPGRAAEVLFLQLMIRHHEGGVSMATAAADLAQREAVRDLARTIRDSQQSEITAMQSLLAART